MENLVPKGHSDDIKDLVGALAKAQGVMKPAVFNKVNPHFKSRYADFSSCMDACRAPLSSNGLAVIQSCETIDSKLSLVTTLAHISGQWMKSEFPIITSKMDSQGIGSAMTYAKRYSLCGMIGIVADEEGDDDGEAAVGRPKKESKPKEEPVEDEAKWHQEYISKFSPENQGIALEYLKKVQEHFKWSIVKTIQELLKDEKKLFDKFNDFKNKIKKTETA